MRAAVGAGIVAACVAALGASAGCGPAYGQAAAATQVLTDVVSLEADRAGLDRAGLARALDAFAASEGYAAPEAARQSPLWEFSRAYLGSHNSLISLGTSSEHVFLTLSRRPDDHADYRDIARRLADRFAPLGFRPATD